MKKAATAQQQQLLLQQQHGLLQQQHGRRATVASSLAMLASVFVLFASSASAACPFAGKAGAILFEALFWCRNWSRRFFQLACKLRFLN